MRVSKATIEQIDRGKVTLPAQEIFNLPEKVLQFGTGVLLRGLPDYFIDKANNENRFKGRVVVVKSTDNGDTSAFEHQDNLYTICTRGLENGQPVERNHINASISRVLSAKKDWAAILQCAHNPQIQFVISNTTEVGIQLQVADVQNEVPVSFPGRLLAFLQERYKAFNGSAESGMLILPTELITNNASELQSIVLQLAQLKNTDASFINWLHTHNRFCNTLVDRIVPGRPDNINTVQNQLGYQDDLLIEAEPFTLWAIEGDEEAERRIGFQDKAGGCIVVKDLNVYRELKLRLLNATHSFCCGLAFFNGFPTVASAMQDAGFKGFVKELLYNEIAPSIPYPIDATEITQFADAVVERFANPYLKHYWINISLQYSLKFKARCIPLLKNYIAIKGQLPPNMIKGFAGYILLMKVTEQKNNVYYGQFNNITYPIQDSEAAFFKDIWQGADTTASVVKSIFANATFGNEALLAINGLWEAVSQQLDELFAQHGLTIAHPIVSSKETVYHEQ